MATKRKPSSPTAELPWATYARLSKAATGDIEKVEYQTKMCHDYAAARGLPISPAHQYEDATLSAWKKGVKRPQWDALMEAAERGEIAGIIVYAVDRFTRRPTDLEALINLAEDHGLSIEGPRSGRLDLTTSTGKQQARWMAMQATSESDNTSERAKTTLARKMREGQPMGGGRSFGFEVGGMVQRPAEVAVLRDVAARLLAGETLQNLAKGMNEQGWRTTRGRAWTGGTLGRVLGLHRYGGHVEHHGNIVGRIKGEPVFDADTYDQVQALLTSRRRGRRPTGDYLLTGLLICSTCQRTMNGARRYQGKSQADGTRPRVYRCPAQQGGCGRVILAQAVEQIVGEHMVRLLADPDTVAAIVAADQQLHEARATIEEKLEAVQQRRDHLEVKFNNFEVSEGAYEKSRATLMAQIEKLKAGRDDLSTATAVGSYDADADWASMRDEEKRLAIRRYQVRIEVLPMQPGTRRFDPSRVTFPQH